MESLRRTVQDYLWDIGRYRLELGRDLEKGLMPSVRWSAMTPRPRYIPVSGPLPTDLGEAEFTQWVVHQAWLKGWCGYHVRNSEGVVQGVHRFLPDEHEDSMGFPDWVFTRGGRVLFRELKTNTGIVSRHQKHWLLVLPDARVWRPRDRDEILGELS